MKNRRTARWASLITAMALLAGCGGAPKSTSSGGMADGAGPAAATTAAAVTGDMAGAAPAAPPARGWETAAETEAAREEMKYEGVAVRDCLQ